MSNNNNKRQQKPAVQYTEAHIEKINDQIVTESKRFLKDPEPSQSKLLAIKLFNFDFDYGVSDARSLMMATAEQLLNDSISCNDEDERKSTVERLKVLLAVVDYFTEIQILGLGLHTTLHY